MIVAQITDTHVETPGARPYGLLDPDAAAARLVEALNALDPQPDLVLHTGDVVQAGSAAEYENFRRLFAGLKAPLVAITGNHDGRDAMRAAFADAGWMPQDGTFIQYVHDVGPLRIVCLDTLVPGSAGGALCDARLAWLDARLAEAPQRPTLVALHHPPVDGGLNGFARIGLEGRDGLADIVARHPQVERLLSGHVHRPVVARFAGTIGFAAPSSCYAFACDLGDDGTISISPEPPAFALHRWDGAVLTTHMVPLGSFGEWIPLSRKGVRLLKS